MFTYQPKKKNTFTKLHIVYTHVRISNPNLFCPITRPPISIFGVGGGEGRRQGIGRQSEGISEEHETSKGPKKSELTEEYKNKRSHERSWTYVRQTNKKGKPSTWSANKTGKCPWEGGEKTGDKVEKQREVQGKVGRRKEERGKTKWKKREFPRLSILGEGSDIDM